jgi:hypothetical protein
VTKDQVEKLISGDCLKTAEDADAAGRLTALAFAGEMGRLAAAFGLVKAAEDVTEDKLDGLLRELGVA